MAINKTGVNKEATKNYKIWKSTPSSDAAMMITPNSAFLIGNKNNFVAASEVGVTLTGNVTMNCFSDQYRVGGMFVHMNDFLRMIPQSIVTPIATLIPFPPIALPLTILRDLPFFLAMLL